MLYAQLCLKESVCFCNQQWQDTVAPCHCSMHSWSWFLHHQSHLWSWVQMSMRPHSWTSPRCCQAWHTCQGWSDWTIHHHSINLRSCTANTSCSTTICCSRNPQASCSPKPYSSNPKPAEGICNCRYSTTNQQNCCHTSPIWSCQ